MRKYMIDRIMFSLCMGYIICYYAKRGAIGAFFSVLAGCLWLFWCWRMLAFLVDLLVGPTTKLLYFSRHSFGAVTLMIESSCGVNLKFVNQRGDKLSLLNLSTGHADELSSKDTPPKEKLLRVTYYRFSKIFVSYELQEGGSETGDGSLS